MLSLINYIDKDITSALLFIPNLKTSPSNVVIVDVINRPDLMRCWISDVQYPC